MTQDPTTRTIADFGAQWTRYTDNSGFYGSPELLVDIFGPLVGFDELKGARVAEIGSGTGRIVAMLLKAGAERVIAIEPSDAFEVLKANTVKLSDRIEYVNGRGEDIPQGRNLDYVFSIGVIHHIPDPAPVVAASIRALRPGGKLFLWLYGYEGNWAYLVLVRPLRWMTTLLPARFLATLCHALNPILDVYILLCRFLPLPLHQYSRNVLSKMSRQKRFLIIYDQLNPTTAKYYREREARDLLENAGFEDIRLYHRHGYSWSVVGIKPDTGLNPCRPRIS